MKKWLFSLKPTALWIALGVFSLATLFSNILVPEIPIFVLGFFALDLGVLFLLIRSYRASFRGRTLSYGTHSLVMTFLVIGVFAVVNFLGSRYPFKWDLTKNKVHTLSDQTKKVVKGLSGEVRARFFSGPGKRDQYRPLLDNFKGLNPKFAVEYVDPFKEPTQAKQLGIKKEDTLHLSITAAGGERTSTVEEPNEEKLINALVKLTQENKRLVCAISGHGERAIKGTNPEGFEAVGKALEGQGYEVRELVLAQENNGVPSECSALLIPGPTKSFFPQEIQRLETYLAGGGRAVFALDLNLRGGEYAPELIPFLAKWGVDVKRALIVDPLSRMFGADASVPLIVTFSKDHAITRDFETQCYFPFLRPVDPAATVPAGLTASWLGKTTPKAWGETDIMSLGKGSAKFEQGKDIAGPLNAAVAVDGKLKDSKASKNTRLAVFGSSVFAINQFANAGGNVDFFVNAVSWVLEDENLISVRAKDEEAGRVELSQKGGNLVFWITVVLVPLLTAIVGIVIWARRRRL